MVESKADRYSRTEAVYEARNLEEALSLGAEDIGVERENLEVIAINKNQYKIKVVRRNGTFDLKIDPAGKFAAIEYLLPPIGEGVATTAEDIFKFLKSAKVVHGINENAIKTAVEEVKARNTPATEIVIAKATPAVDGIDAKITYTPEKLADYLQPGSTFRYLVRKGEEFAEKTTLQPDKAGISIYGQEFYGKKPSDNTPAVGNTLEADVGGRIKAKITGYLFLERSNRKYPNGVLEIEPAVQVSADAMAATLTLYPSPPKIQKMPTAALMEDLLLEQGVEFGIRKKDLPKIEKYIAAKNSPIKNVRVAEGRNPVKGEDGRVDFAVSTRPDVGKLREDGSIDFRQQGFLKPVKAGALLAERKPPGSGKPGTNVLGKKIEAQAGQDVNLHAGTKVQVSPDGKQFTAGTNGVVLCKGPDDIQIVDLFEHQGDVDYSVGNLKMEGALRIHGSVKPDFSVEANGDLLIDGLVESARVMATGAVAVNRGIVGKSFVQAGTTLAAAYAEGGTLISDGDISILDTLLHCTVFCKGRVEVLQRAGKLVGGVCILGESMEVRELGASSGIRTRVIIGLSRKQYLEIENLEGQITSIREEIQRPGTDTHTQNRYMELMKGLKEQLESFKEQLPRKFNHLEVKVQGKVYPGTEISFGLFTAKISEPLNHCAFVFDAGNQSIQQKPL